MSSLPFIILGEIIPINKKISAYLDYETEERFSISRCCHKPIHSVAFFNATEDLCDDCAALSAVVECLFPTDAVSQRGSSLVLSQKHL